MLLIIGQPVTLFVDTSAHNTPACTILQIQFQKFPGGKTFWPSWGRERPPNVRYPLPRYCDSLSPVFSHCLRQRFTVPSAGRIFLFPRLWHQHHPVWSLWRVRSHASGRPGTERPCARLSQPPSPPQRSAVDVDPRPGGFPCRYHLRSAAPVRTVQRTSRFAGGCWCRDSAAAGSLWTASGTRGWTGRRWWGWGSC